ncbi:MAG: hypothetical protein ABH850_01290, partial [Candidatus Micrarchaeota archaeon]
SRNYAIKKTAELAGIQGEPVLKEFSSSQQDFFSLLSSAGYSFGTGFISSIKANNAKFELQAK